MGGLSDGWTVGRVDCRTVGLSDGGRILETRDWEERLAAFELARRTAVQ